MRRVIPVEKRVVVALWRLATDFFLELEDALKLKLEDKIWISLYS